MSNNMISLASKQHCTGCGACMQSCPQKAIYYQNDEEGFPTPYINAEKCVNCGACNRACPALHLPEMHPIQAAYAAQILDKNALAESSSGGLFTLLSREILHRGGVVYGCVWDENYNAVIRKAENEEEIKPMRGSKYVWSWAGDVFPEIKQYLEQGRAVLFTGLSCQAAGLKSYLKKDYEKLYVLDFLCSGSPSPLAFNKWLDTLCDKQERKSLNLRFRDKKPYGVGVHITYHGQKKKTPSRGGHVINPYYYSFFSHMIDRLSCYKCPYGTDQRISDFTMGDYWGIENYHADMDINAGVSAFLVNTDKGMKLLEVIKESVVLVPTKKENIGKANNLRCNGSKRNRQVPDSRNLFFQDLKEKGWAAAEKKHLHNRKRLIAILKNKIPMPVITSIKKLMKH